MSKSKLGIVLMLIAASIIVRLVTHFWEILPAYNFTPVLAMALFAGAAIKNKKLALLVPLLAMFISDLIIGLYSSILFTYVAIGVVVAIGFMLQKKRSVLRIGGAGLAGSVLFFILSNFTVWAFGTMYPMTISGLAACYVAAIPFFHNTLASTLFFSGVIFGAYHLCERSFGLETKPVTIR